MRLKNNLSIDFNDLTVFYTSTHYKINNISKYKLLYFSVYMHKKLNYFGFFNNKHFNLSNGQLLQKKVKSAKFYKKSSKSFGFSINILKKRLKKKLSSIFLFFCKNINYKNYNWIKKYFYIIKPKISYLILTNSWNSIIKHKRRVKKKIMRNLLKNIKSV